MIWPVQCPLWHLFLGGRWQPQEPEKRTILMRKPGGIVWTYLKHPQSPYFDIFCQTCSMKIVWIVIYTGITWYSHTARIAGFWSIAKSVSWRIVRPSRCGQFPRSAFDCDQWWWWQWGYDSHPICHETRFGTILVCERFYRWEFCGDIPLHRPYIGLIHGRYLQFRFLKWPLILAAFLERELQEFHNFDVFFATTGWVSLPKARAAGMWYPVRHWGRWSCWTGRVPEDG